MQFDWNGAIIGPGVLVTSRFCCSADVFGVAHADTINRNLSCQVIMPLNERELRRIIMSRILATFLFAAVVCIASDCHAQRHRGLFARGARHHAPLRQEKLINREHPARHKHPVVPRYYDPESSRYDETGWERYPKYIGGFHASHWYNIGVPPGDIGFRGNGIYWAPWQ